MGYGKWFVFGALFVCIVIAQPTQDVTEFIKSLNLTPEQQVLLDAFLQDLDPGKPRACFDPFCNDPDCGLNVTQLIQSKGYPVEDHYALTPDGFFLSLQHIPYGRNGPGSTDLSRPPVLLQHGLLDASHTWVINFPEESLGFILADAGYDVWLGNNRGNTYSMTNLYYTPDESDFWDFSWDQMASYDLSTEINFVLSQTNHTQLFYVGHSEGTTQAFAGFSTNKTLASQVKLFVALAPVAYVGDLTSYFLQTLATLRVDVILELLGFNHFLINSCWLDNLIDLTCDIDDAVLCQVSMCVIMGCNPTNINATRYDVYGQLDPAGTSVQNINHWGQMVRQDNYCMYDYMTRHENEKHYGQAHPPCYDLSEMAAPIALFSGEKDKLADPTDVQRTIAALNPDLIVYQSVIPYYEHLDFIWGMDANQVLYPQILSLFESMSD